MVEGRKLEGRRVLVTGAAGFLGRHLCRRLVEAGAIVHGTSRRERRADGQGIRWWRADLTELDATRRVLHSINADVLFHLSGLVTGIPSINNILPTVNTLFISTVNVLMIASENSCGRVVLAGSLTEPHGPCETPGSPYAAAKWAATVYGRMFYELYSLPVVLCRIFMTYGPGQETRKLIPSVARALARGQTPRISMGKWQYDWIYVDDVIAGLMAAARKTGIDGTTIDLGSGTLTTVRNVAQRLCELSGVGVIPAVGTVPDRPLEPIRVADVADAYSKLEWKAGTTLDQGLAKTLEWYRCLPTDQP